MDVDYVLQAPYFCLSVFPRQTSKTAALAARSIHGQCSVQQTRLNRSIGSLLPNVSKHPPPPHYVICNRHKVHCLLQQLAMYCATLRGQFLAVFKCLRSGLFHMSGRQGTWSYRCLSCGWNLLCLIDKQIDNYIVVHMTEIACILVRFP